MLHARQTYLWLHKDKEIVGIVSKSIQHMQLAIILYLHVLHQMYRIHQIATGAKTLNFFSVKKEILLKIKRLSTNDVEKLFEKVKEALEASQHVVIIKT